MSRGLRKSWSVAQVAVLKNRAKLASASLHGTRRPTSGCRRVKEMVILGQCAPDQIALDRYAVNGHATSVAKHRLDQDRKQASTAFGERLRKLRDRQELSQDALADATDIHPTAIGRMERGAREPRLTTILRLADGLEVQPGELLNGLGKASKTPQNGS